VGWCAGRNPPSVQRRHPAKRATRASLQNLTGAYLPFHLAGQPFQRFHFNILNDLARITVTRWMDVSFLLRSQDSRPAPLTDATSLQCGRSFLRCFGHPEPSASSPAKKILINSSPIRVTQTNAKLIRHHLNTLYLQGRLTSGEMNCARAQDAVLDNTASRMKGKSEPSSYYKLTMKTMQRPIVDPFQRQTNTQPKVSPT